MNFDKYLATLTPEQRDAVLETFEKFAGPILPKLRLDRSGVAYDSNKTNMCLEIWAQTTEHQLKQAEAGKCIHALILIAMASAFESAVKTLGEHCDASHPDVIKAMEKVRKASEMVAKYAEKSAEGQK